MKQKLCCVFILGAMVALLGACASGRPFAGVDSLGSASGTDNAAVGEGAMIKSPVSQQPVQVDKSQFQRAGEISSPTWINSDTLNWKDLRGKVVVADFWTFACYNCKNTLPYLKNWGQKYRDRGLVVLGVHSPELSFEKDVENVRRAVKDYEIKYPVAIDGDFANWSRYNVRAWPTWFIVDKEGYVRYSHIGEGDYAGSEQVIQQLLAE